MLASLKGVSFRFSVTRSVSNQWSNQIRPTAVYDCYNTIIVWGRGRTSGNGKAIFKSLNSLCEGCFSIKISGQN